MGSTPYDTKFKQCLTAEARMQLRHGCLAVAGGFGAQSSINAHGCAGTLYIPVVPNAMRDTVLAPGGYALDPTVAYCGLLSITLGFDLSPVPVVVAPTPDSASTGTA
jgi:hypothetical protein